MVRAGEQLAFRKHEHGSTASLYRLGKTEVLTTRKVSVWVQLQVSGSPSTHIIDCLVPNHPNHSGKPTHLMPCSLGLLRVAAALTAAYLGQHISFKVFA